MARSAVKNLTGILLFLLLAIALGVASLLFFISRLELDDYRRTLERRLSSALNQPVTIEAGSLTYHQGLALELRRIRIGAEQSLLVDIPRLTATLLLSPLLDGELVFENIDIEGAQAHLWLPLADIQDQPTTESGSFISSLTIRTLRLRNADLHLYREHGETRPVRLTNLHAVVQPQHDVTQLVVSGQEPDSGGDFLLETRLPAAFVPTAWRSADLQARLQLVRFHPGALVDSLATTFPHAVNVDLSLDGSPGTGARVTTTVSRTGTATPLLSASGNWHSNSGEDTLDLISASLFGFPVDGRLRLQHRPRTFEAHLATTDQALTPESLKGLQQTPLKGLRSATLDTLMLRFEHRWTQEPDVEPAPIEGRLAVSGLNWEENRPWSITALATDLSLTAGDLFLSNALLTTDLGSIAGAGSIHKVFSKPELDLRTSARPELELLRRHLSVPADWSLSGFAALSLHLRGSVEQPRFQLLADATQSRLQFGHIYSKPHAQPAMIEIDGAVQAAGVQIERFSISLDPFLLTGQGKFHGTAEGLHAAITTQAVALDQLASLNPALERLRLRGLATAKLTWTPDHWHAQLSLDQGGAHLTSLIGELNSVSGTADLNRDGLSFRQLPANLGESAFIVTGTLHDWHDPQLRLAVSSPRARALDLVFLNPELTLYDIQGNLEINRHGILFDPVSVTLEEATRATVRGHVTNFSDPRVDLDIHGDRADVLEIIALFRDPAAGAPAPPSARRSQQPIVIRARALEGTLGGLKFTNADARIVEHDGILTVHPLTFENGAGWCRAKVEFNRHQPAAPLKISGHVNGIDASALHQDLLDRPGLIRGSLTGDFYLEGNPADGGFWKHANGGLHAQIHDGTLRRFRGLAQVFSLLNVSQIFSGRLPDMDREGMPFNLLEGSVALTAGVLHTDDLRITSEAMNMSLVGKRDLTDDSVNLILGVMPLRTVDKVVSSIPIAGWVLGGEDRALLTAYFRIEGDGDNPTVTAIPVGSLSSTIFGIFRRTLGLPEKLLKDLGELLQPEATKKTEP